MLGVTLTSLMLMALGIVLLTAVVLMLVQRLLRRAIPKSEVDQLVDRVHALLPHTQCEQCGQPGCRPYAIAVVNGATANRCAPGGEPVARALAELLARPILMPAQATPIPSIARIREADCIGCTRCIPVCPVDAIIGASMRMHTVLEDQCTGCGLCIAPCPVDCIDLLPIASRTASTADHQPAAHAMPCIHCAACADVCPVGLQPHALLRQLEADRSENAVSLGLLDCTTCGACDAVCPSRIPLRERFVAAQRTTRDAARLRNAAAQAATRFSRHQTRRVAMDVERERKRNERLADRLTSHVGDGLDDQPTRHVAPDNG